MVEKLYGSVEAGGTKFVCMVASGPDDIRSETRFPTTNPDETLVQVISFFRRAKKSLGQSLAGVGVGCFGPLDLDPHSATYGYITSTPKPGWRNTDISGILNEALGVPVAIDTDVTAAALGEYRWGSGLGLRDILYLTIGTGIGGGALCGGQPLHGLVHPEMGHIRLPHDRLLDSYPGCCPFHGDCFEGLASGPALKGRWGQPAETLAPGHPAWELEAGYIALALHNYVCTLSPEKIILGGGVMKQPQLFSLVQTRLVTLLNGYVQSEDILTSINQYVVAPTLGDRAGVLGGLALAIGLDKK